MGHRAKWKTQKFLKPLETFMLLEENMRKPLRLGLGEDFKKVTKA